MRKIFWYTILVFFFCMGCDANANLNKHKPIIEKSPTYQDVITEEEVEDEYEPVDEDEQLKQILLDKAKEIYAKHRINIISFLVKWIAILFGTVLCLYWIIRLLNLISPYRLGFTFVWVMLCLLSIIYITSNI